MKALLEKEKEATETRWQEKTRAALAEDSPERKLKKKMQAAVGQSPSPSKPKAAALLPLARAPISKLAMEAPPPAPQLAGPALSFQELPPVTAQQAGQAPTFPRLLPSRPVQSFQEVDSGLAKKYKELQAKEKAAATRRLMKAEKEEQFRWLKDEGAFKTQEGRDHMIRHFKVIVDRHRKREISRNRILLGKALYSEKFHSKCYDEHTAAIKEGCSEDPSGNTFRALIENYEDFDHYSTDTEQNIDELVAFGYAGTTAMCSQTPSGTGSRSSESSVEGPQPFMDLTGGPMDRTEKLPDLDKMFTPVTPQAEKTPIKETPPSSDKKKSKKKKKAKRGEAAEMSTSTPRVPGPKETALQEALDEIVLRDQLDEAFGKLPETEQPAPLGVQAPAISLQEVTPMEGE